ncbi:hypothetical protein [Streptomyces atratus]|uniref:hypothetical protein n=1 Tax=Streptomyces atratus TaxID=1893 RepID=UPI0033C47682
MWWIAALHDNAETTRQLAMSPNLGTRRSVARARHLPPDVANLLAHDEDRIVRLYLTESCDDAPADVLLDVWSWWHGSFSFPGRPRNHPNFPRHDLLRFAQDPEPRIRLLALDDHASDAALVERFSRDPDAQVRSAAAGDPRLSPESAVRRADDADQAVRSSAWRNPALPPTVLIPLLLNEHSAEDAARNHRSTATAWRTSSHLASPGSTTVRWCRSLPAWNSSGPCSATTAPGAAWRRREHSPCTSAGTNTSTSAAACEIDALKQPSDDTDPRWSQIDDLITEGRRIQALQRIRDEFGGGIHDALDLLNHRYIRLQQDQSKDFTTGN